MKNFIVFSLLFILSFTIIGCSSGDNTIETDETPVVDSNSNILIYSGVLLDVTQIFQKKPYELIENLNNDFGPYFPDGIVETLKKNYKKYGTPQFGSVLFELYNGIDVSVCFHSDNTYCKDESGLWFNFKKNEGYNKGNVLPILNIENFSEKSVNIGETTSSVEVRIDL